MSDFYPISPIVGVTNTSYAAQAGVMDEKWACRVLRGKKIIAEKTMVELNLDAFVGVIYGHIRVEGISRHYVAMAAGRLMQFARRYQQSGVCPNFEIPDLVYDDGTTTGGGAVETTATVSEGSIDVPAAEAGESGSGQITVSQVGHLPQLTPLIGNKLWEESIEVHSMSFLEMASYTAGLPDGHVEAMFNRIADDLLWIWSQSGDGLEMVTKFCKMIQSFSKENQLPRTGTDKVTIETGRCELLCMSHDFDPDASRLPAGYPCAFHEKLAARVSELTGAKININTSSTGCSVVVTLE